MGYYVMNRETQKLELHFSKEEYMSLPEELKKGVRSNFLFSKKNDTWMSRAKFPNLWRAEAVVEKLGLEDGGKVGEKLTFAEQMERKAERAEKRAERYEHKADMAVQKGEALQQPIWNNKYFEKGYEKEKESALVGHSREFVRKHGYFPHIFLPVSRTHVKDHIARCLLRGCGEPTKKNTMVVLGILPVKDKADRDIHFRISRRAIENIRHLINNGVLRKENYIDKGEKI